MDRVEVDADVVRIIGNWASPEAAAEGSVATAGPGLRSSVR